MRCTICKKDRGMTRWDKIRLFFFGFFKEDIQDLSEDKYTKGFGEGYKEGYSMAMTYKDPVLSKAALEDYLKKWTQ